MDTQQWVYAAVWLLNVFYILLLVYYGALLGGAVLVIANQFLYKRRYRKVTNSEELFGKNPKDWLRRHLSSSLAFNDVAGLVLVFACFTILILLPISSEWRKFIAPFFVCIIPYYFSFYRCVSVRDSFQRNWHNLGVDHDGRSRHGLSRCSMKLLIY